jgi:ABC-type nitrate/sulfonate/bicarbonate transport system permease component
MATTDQMDSNSLTVANKLSAFAGRFSEGQLRNIVRISTLATIIVLWEITGYMLQDILWAPFSTTIVTLVELATTSDMLELLLGTVQEMFLGYSLAVLVAVPVGLAMGQSDIVEELVEPWVSALFVTATSSLLPLLIVMFGTGLEMRIIIVWISSVFHILLNIYHGSENVGEEFLDVAHSFGLSRYQTFKSIVFPGTLPYIIAGLRMGIGRAIQGIILAETYVIVGFGGYLHDIGYQSITMDPVMAAVLVIMVLAFTLRNVLTKAQDLLIPWSDAEETEMV